MTDLELQSNRLQTDRLGVTMTIYKEVNRQRQGRQAAQPEAAVSLPEGEHRLSMRSSGLWSFEGDYCGYTVKRRQADSTKPALYIMAELKPKPAYVSSLYFRSYSTGQLPEASEFAGITWLSGWHYVAQAPGADSPLLFVSLWRYKADKSQHPHNEPEWHSITINREFYCPLYNAPTFATIDGQAFMA